MSAFRYSQFWHIPLFIVERWHVRACLFLFVYQVFYYPCLSRDFTTVPRVLLARLLKRELCASKDFFFMFSLHWLLKDFTSPLPPWNSFHSIYSIKYEIFPMKIVTHNLSLQCMYILSHFPPCVFCMDLWLSILVILC